MITPEPNLNLSSSYPDLKAGEDSVVSIIREELSTGKRVVKVGTVRLTKSVQQRPETVSEMLASEHIEVERVPKNEMVSSAPAVRTEGEVTIIPVVEEILVTTKHLRLKEELRITKKQVVREHREQVMLLSEDLTVERFGVSQPDSPDQTAVTK